MINTKQDLMAVIRDLREELQELKQNAIESVDSGLPVRFEDVTTLVSLVEMTEDLTLGAVKVCESPQEAV